MLVARQSATAPTSSPPSPAQPTGGAEAGDGAYGATVSLSGAPAERASFQQTVASVPIPSYPSSSATQPQQPQQPLFSANDFGGLRYKVAPELGDASLRVRHALFLWAAGPAAPVR